MQNSHTVAGNDIDAIISFLPIISMFYYNQMINFALSHWTKYVTRQISDSGCKMITSFRFDIRRLIFSTKKERENAGHIFRC